MIATIDRSNLSVCLKRLSQEDASQSSTCDYIFLCASKGELKRRFEELHMSVNSLGRVNRAVLVQDCVEGKEFVLDCVSLSGVHKVVALWEHDKRQAYVLMNQLPVF